MEHEKKRDWGLVLAGGLLIICAFVFIAAPGVTLITLTMLAGAAMLVAGVFDIVAYVRFRDSKQASGWTVFYGILDIIIGLMFLVHPVALMAIIPWLIGLFVLVFGIYELVVSLKVKKMGSSMWGWLAFSAIVSIIMALLFFFFPDFFVYYIAVFLLFRGMSLLLSGLSTNDDQLWV